MPKDISPQLDEIRNWLNQNGWTKVRQLPDSMASNVKNRNTGKSFADLVYRFLEETNGKQIFIDN